MLLLQGMSSPRHAASSSGPSLNGDGTGGGSSDGEFSPKRLFERRKKNILNNNGDVEDGLEESSKKTRVKGIRGGVITSSLRSTGSTITSVLQMGKRLWQSPNRRAEMIHIIKNNRRIVLLILIAIPFILRPSRLWKWSYLYFGRHNIHGGAYGRLVEYLVNKWTWQETQRQQQMQLQQLGVVLPTMYNNGKFIPHLIQTQAALRELLVRRQVRGNTLVALERNANAVARADHSTNSNDDSCQDEDGCSPRRRFLIPHVLFVPDVINWNPPRPGKVKAFQKLLFDEQEMKLLVADTAPFPTPLVDQWWDASGILDQIQLFALCAINHFGGVFVSEEDGLSSIQEEDNSNIVTDMLYSSTGWFEEATSTTSTASKKIQKTRYNPHGGGGGSFGIVVLGNNSTINTIAATPRHPFLYCALRNLEQSIAQHDYSSIDAASIIILSLSSLSAIQKTPTIGWTRLWSTCQSHNKNSAADCCTDINSESFTSDLKFSDLLAAESKGPAAVAELWFLQLPSPKAIAPSKPAKPITVTIRQESSGQQLQHGTGKATKKVSLDLRLQSLGLQPSWLCARCIRVPTYGTMDKCSKFCPSKGYTDFVCHSPDVPEVVQVPLNIIVQGAGGSGPLASSRISRSTMIPRIIHQTWFEDIDLDRYPQLARLRNGWKNTGWQYRLYTDTTARKYIADYFPALFVEAFDVLVPGAYKADLFRYLVLLREGGVYADIDVLLETTLDTFLTPTMSFFAARDVVCEHANEAHCLWNGLIGVSPGHPFIVKAVERVINLILNRADLFDLERDLCRDSNEPLEIWKVHGQTLLFLSGPCALGVSVNTVLGRPALQALEVGWIGLDELDYGVGRKDHGDALILVVDKFDIGSFRISDPERSFIVASTNLDNVEKDARIPSDMTEGERKRQDLRHTEARLHYSNATKSALIWGSTGVYSDDFVANERFKLSVRYESG